MIIRNPEKQALIGGAKTPQAIFVQAWSIDSSQKRKENRTVGSLSGKMICD